MYFVDHINIATTTSDIENILSDFAVLIKIRISIDVMMVSITIENISLLPDGSSTLMEGSISCIQLYLFAGIMIRKINPMKKDKCPIILNSFFIISVNIFQGDAKLNTYGTKRGFTGMVSSR